MTKKTFGIGIVSAVLSSICTGTVFAQDILQASPSVTASSLSPGLLALSIFFGIALLWIAWGVLFLLSVFKKFKTFSREDLLSTAWHLTNTHWKLLAGLFFAQQLIAVAPGFVGLFLANTLGVSSQTIVIALNIIFAIIGFLATLFILQTLLHLYDAKTITRFEFSLTRQQVLSFFAAAFLTGLATVIGLALFIVPGILIGISLSFFPLLIIEKQYQPIQALKSSFALTKGRRFELFLLFLLLAVINIAGLSAAYVGLFFTLPFSMFVWIGAYRTLSPPNH